MSSAATDIIHQLFAIAGQAALVTGAASGIGKGIATALAAAGVRVAIADIDGEGARSLAEELQAGGASAKGFALDVRSEDQVVAVVHQAATWLGGLDILVNNAGIYPKTPLLTSTAADWDNIHAINARGTFLGVREGARTMAASGGGCIINISSMGGVRSAYAGRSAYNAAKAAVNRLTGEAAIELAPQGIRVNAILPGPVSPLGDDQLDERERIVRAKVKQQVPLGFMGTPQDIAAAVIYLASPAARFVTGHCLLVDGGAVLI